MSLLPSIGLQRGAVAVHLPSPLWPKLYADEAARLLPVLSGRHGQLEHVGSTSVPGLAAKPVIDLAFGLPDLAEVVGLSPGLAGLGYTSFGERELRGDFFFALGPDERRTHYLHVVLLGGARWQDYLRFRDRLRTDPSLRDAYAQLKFELAERHAADRLTYTAAKEEFIRRALAG